MNHRKAPRTRVRSGPYGESLSANAPVIRTDPGGMAQRRCTGGTKAGLRHSPTEFMKTHPVISFTGIAFALASMPAVHAVPKTWRIDNVPGHPADFSSVTAAVADSTVSDGDTLVIQGDFTATPLVLTRRLHLVGYGYFHAENGYTFPAGTAVEARLGAVTVEPGAGTRADGCSITGCVTGEIVINDAANVTIRRNKIRNLLLSGAGAQSARGITVAQNYFFGNTANYATTVNFYPSASVGDVLICGNYIANSGNNWNPGSSLSVNAGQTATVLNNVLYGTSMGGYGAFQNNCVFNGFNAGTWVTVKNNIAVGGSFFPAGAGNLNDRTLVDVFENGVSTDGRWKARAGGPAIGAGTDGYDIGMFSGPLPYVLSGLPPVPVITRLQVPAVVKDGETVSIAIKAEVKP